MRAGLLTRRTSRPALPALVAGMSILAATFTAATSHATPPIVQPKAILTVPDPAYADRVQSVAIDGDTLLMGATQERFAAELGNFVMDGAVFLFTRTTNGTWQYTRTLWTGTESPSDPLRIAMRGNIIAIDFDEPYVFERNASGTWQPSPIEEPYDFSGPAGDIEIDNGTIIVASACIAFRVRAARKNASGAWALAGDAESDPAGDPNRCVSRFEDVAISGNTTLLSAERLADATSADYFFSGPPQTWTLTQRVAGYTLPVALEGDFAVLGRAGTLRAAPELFQRTSGVWAFKQRLERPDRLVIHEATTAELRNKLAVVSFHSAASVFQGDSNNNYREFARLVAPGDRVGFTSLDVSGRRIVMNDAWQPRAFVYEVPTTISQPASIQDTFNSGSSARWTPIAGSSWTVATTPASRVYRQSSLAGEAGAVLGNSDWTDQSIQADVKPTAFSGTDRWLGLAVRRLDAFNYYYVTARQSNVIQLKKMVNGAFQTLASAPLPLTLNTTYRLRLEAIGPAIRVFVNDKLALQVADSSLTRGSAALLMYRTAADFDNVIATPSPQVTLVDRQFTEFNFSRWQRVSGDWSLTNETEPGYRQNSLAGNATLLTGVSTGDQSIQAVATPRAFEGPGRWFGLFARWQNSSNYYYVTVRNTSEISLRKLTAGAIQVLDSAPLSLGLDAEYKLRLEVIEDQLRVYVDDRLILEATDTSFAEGRYGLMTYKAVAEYRHVQVTQP